MTPDYIVVGAGLTGATIARVLHDAGKDVLVVERREVVAGNCHDYMESGIRVQTYGPHCFRTNSEAVWKFVNRFSEWYDFAAKLLTNIDGTIAPWPPMVTNPGLPDGVAIENFEDAVLSKMCRIHYDAYVRGYTIKQWGVHPRELLPTLATRVKPRKDPRDTRLSQYKYQALPRQGFTALVEAMLEGIQVERGIDWLSTHGQFEGKRRTFYTGALDELFDFNQGRLMYRAQRREHHRYPAKGFHQPGFQVNYPSLNVPHIRSIEWRWMMEIPWIYEGEQTIITTETPYTPDSPLDYEYPFPTAANHALYAKYRTRADAIPGLQVCGRLGEYRYLDMDQAIARAMVLAQRELDRA